MSKTVWPSLALLVALPSGCSLIVPSSADFQYSDAATDAGVVSDTGVVDAGCPDLCGGECTNLRTDPLHCGSCSRSCSAPDHGVAVCDEMVCDFECEGGFVRELGMCVDRGVPRPIFPPSTSTVTSRRPTLRWELPSRSDGARVELCEDRVCTAVLETIDAVGESARPSADLPAGPVFWRLFSYADGEAGATRRRPGSSL